MTAPATVPETVVQAGKSADLPTAEQTCPFCEVTGPCQQLLDHPTMEDPPIPYGCGSCGAEFTA